MRGPIRTHSKPALVLALLAAGLLFASPARAVLTNRWTFSNLPGHITSGSVVLDSISNATAVVRGNDVINAGQLELMALNNQTGNATAGNISGYISLPNGIISSKTNLTLEIWARTIINPPVSERLFDFGNATITSGQGAAPGQIIDGPNPPGNYQPYNDLGLVITGNFFTGFSQSLVSMTGGGPVYQANSYAPVDNNLVIYHFVLTFSDNAGAYGMNGGELAWYFDGQLVSTLDVPFHLNQIADVNDWIARSQSATDNMGTFNLEEVRLYNHAMSAAEIAASDAAGPTSLAVAQPPMAVSLNLTLNYGGSVALTPAVTSGGYFTPGSVVIVQPPQYGTATVTASGQILYTNTANTSAADSFTYTVASPEGTSAPATVSLTFAASPHLANTALNVPAAAPTFGYQAASVFPNLYFNKPLGLVSPPGDIKRLFILEQTGQIKVIPDITAASPTESIFLDLPTLLTSRGETMGTYVEEGLLGATFHPNFAQNHYFYVFYSVFNGTNLYERLSRFTTIAGNTSIADPTSEVILINELDRAYNHNGGDLHFGPDGYLYVSVGDEGEEFDALGDAQVLNGNFFSGLLRIDVDKKPGNLEPNPNPNIPLDANGKAYYSVPIDNPFVLTDNGGTWDGSGYFAGRDANLTTRDPNFDYSTIRTEFWAYGMRNPWRFSFDSATGTLWLADVGQNTYEEVDLMQKGGNYGWPFFEGTYNTQTDANISGGYVSAGTVYPTPVPPANPSPFLNPIYEYSHGSGPLQGDAVIGGLVYHGANLPALDGMYIFGDYSGGNIWSLCYNGTGTNVQVLANSPGLAGFGLDPSNGDVLVANNGNGQVQRLSLSVSNGTFPTTLSATGLFANLTNLSPAPGVVPYSVNLPSWNDGAQTSYWFAIPDGVSQMTWGQDTPWTFPAGMIWVQNLDLETTPGDPTTLKHIETRVLVSNTTGVYGVNYQWNAAQTDATIVPAAGANLSLNLTVNDTTQTQIWHFPGEADCLSCHNANAGYALSFNTRQLNRVQNLNGNVGNQIDLLSQFGYFANSPPASGTLPAYPALDDATQSLETRVRAYLAVNCADCHQPGGNVTGALNLLPQASLAQTNLIDGNVATNTNGDPANRYLVPDDLTHSVVYQQMAAGNGFSRMPPLASNILDPDGLALLQAWIGNLSTNAPPSIFTQPANVTVLLGHGANFTVAAIGEQPLAFQWQKNGVSIPGATNTTLTLPNVGGAAAGNYAVMISDPAGNITSATATLTVLIPPSIAGPPENVTVLAGKKVILSVSATGTAPLQYQWYFNGKKIPGATRTTLTLGDVGKVNSGKYSVVVTGPGGTAGSTTVTLAVLQSAFPPTILTQPRSLTVKAGQTARFVVQSLGTPPMSYQWQKNNRVVANVGNVSGATTAKLQIVRVTFANAGSYRVVVTNPAGAVVSAPAKLVVK